MFAPLLLRTKLAPPRLHRRLLPRPTLIAKLREAIDYRLTLVEAGTGYGKSTALASLADGQSPARIAWYSIDDADADPQHFLSYLIASFKQQLPSLSETPLALLQDLGNNGSAEQWTRVLDALVNVLADTLREPMLLVLDDYHFVTHTPEVNTLTERFVNYLPSHLHVIISSRHPFNLPGLLTWRARGDVLTVGRDSFAFRPSEIEALFRDTYGMSLTPADVAVLADKTEGWPIALQLVWQGLRSSETQNIASILAPSPTTLGALFDYLARDVLDRQPPEIASFLRETAVLRELTPEACDAVTTAPLPGSGAMLRRLHELDLFIVALDSSGQHYRYHHLFHDFLRGQTSADIAGIRARHRRAAQHFDSIGNTEEAIYHWLAARAFDEAAVSIESIAEATLRNGRLDTVAAWIDSLPADILARHPLLQYALGDLYRLRSRFDDALQWYVTAEQTWRARNDPAGISRALRGQALIYLDTVRPTQARSLLEEALRLSDGVHDLEARARLLELLAENKLNMGKPAEAEQLRAEALALREQEPSEDALSVRVKLRTGRLDDARQILETWLETERRDAERGQVHPPRAHRETVLLLSLVDSLRGDAARAFALAEQGIALGEKIGSPFVTAVSHIRLGHAWQLRTDVSPRTAADEAARCYQAAIALGDRLAVRRTRAEAMWGLARAYGFFGDLDSAQRNAAEAVEICRWAGDLWLTSIAELTLGASCVLAGRPADSVELLSRVLTAFRDCGDTFGRTATRLWLSLAYFDVNQPERFAPCAEDLLALCEAHSYEFLFTAPTLFGPPDPRRLVPILIAAREGRIRATYAAHLLAEIGLPEIKVHPGYQLRVQALGTFRVWRGMAEVDAREWKRDKARQLFQLLLTQRRRPMQREEITEQLWPSLSPEAAARDFKVALNALNKTLEPDRHPDAPFAFVVRDGVSYSIRPEADLWLDADTFEREADLGLRAADPDFAMHHLRAALSLYTGNFLTDALYEDWASEERERLLALYLRAADKLAALLIERGEYNEGLSICESILTHDSCWERAYRIMMAAQALQGNRPQALRVYQRCATALHDELGVAPSPATESLHTQIAQSAEIDVTSL